MRQSDHRDAAARLSTLYQGLDLPGSVQFDITRRCNLSCIHCYQLRSRAELDGPSIRRILDDLAQSKVLMLSFSGGEPLLHPAFFEILDHARNLHFAIKVTSNGTLIDEKAAARLGEAGVGEVSISLYSLDPGIHERVTLVEGSHAKSMAACRFLKSAGVPVRLLCTVTSVNLPDAREVFQWGRSEGFEVTVDPLILTGEPGRTVQPWLRPKADEALALLTELDLVPDPVLLPSPDDPALCGAGIQSALITPEGDVKLCPVAIGILGRLGERSFEEIWRTSRLRKKFISRRLRPKDRCYGCSLRGSCRTCPPQEEMEKSGDIEAYFEFVRQVAEGMYWVWQRRHPGIAIPKAEKPLSCPYG